MECQFVDYSGVSMKICMVVGGVLESGGIQTQAVELSRALADRGHQVRIFCMGVDMSVPQNVTVDIIGERPFTLGVYRKLHSLRKAGLIDIVHAQGCAGFNVLLNRLVDRVPLVETFHSTAISEYRVSTRSLFAKWFYFKFYVEEFLSGHAASQIICVSNYTKNQAVTHYMIGQGKMSVIPNGIDTSRFCDSLGHDKGGSTILIVGRIDPRKGYLEFIRDVAPGIVRQLPGVKINIVGKMFETWPQYNESLRQGLAANSLSDHVKLLGGVPFEELRMYYNTSDLFLLPSKEEGFGIVLLEAQSCGLPVVAFNNSGIKEAVDSGRSGYLVETPGEMADRVAEILSDQAKAKLMGDNARSFAAGFSWDIIAKRVETVYESVLKTR